MQTRLSAPVAIDGTRLIAWVLGIVAWVVICSGAWFVAARADYAKLAQARICYDLGGGRSASSHPQCANIKPSDALFYQSEIDRKARNSRLAAAFGALVAAIFIIVTQRKKRSTPV